MRSECLVDAAQLATATAQLRWSPPPLPGPHVMRESRLGPGNWTWPPHLPQASRGQPAPPPFAGHQGHAFRSACSRVTLVTVALVTGPRHSVQGEEGPAAFMPPEHLHTRDFLHRGGSPQPGKCRGERPAAEPRFHRKRARGGRPGGEAAHCLVRWRRRAGSPGDGLAFAAVTISIPRIIDVHSHHLSCHLNRQLDNSQFYFPASVFRRSVNLNGACFPSSYIRLCFLSWAFPLDFGSGSFYMSNNVFCLFW